MQNQNQKYVPDLSQSCLKICCKNETVEIRRSGADQFNCVPSQLIT